MIAFEVNNMLLLNYFVNFILVMSMLDLYQKELYSSFFIKFHYQLALDENQLLNQLSMSKFYLVI